MRYGNTLRATTLVCLWAAAASLHAGPSAAAVGDHIWSAGHDVTGNGVVGMDPSGNIVQFGTFFNTVDFGGGPMTGVNIVAGDLYLARFDASGNHLWSQQITPVGGVGLFDPRVAADPAGNIYVTGRLISGTVDFGGGALAGGQGVLAMFDAAGNHVWSTGIGDGRIMSLEATGTHLIAAGYTGSSAGVDFGGGAVGTAGGNDVFVAKLTAAGAHVWSAGFGDASDQATFGVSIDGSGNVVVVGSMFGTVDFGGGPLVANGLDLFLASFTSAGAHGWSQVFDGTFTLGVGILVTVALDTGPSGEVAIAGEMRSTVDFGGGMLTSAGFSDMYIAAFDATGAHQWSALYGSAGGSEKAQSLRIDGSGNLITSGIFGADTDFGGGTLSIVAGTTVFAALYDASGAHLFSSGYGSYVYECYSHVDVNGDYLLHSSAYSDIDFGGGPITGNPVIAKFEGAGGTASSIGDTPGASGLSLAAYPNPFNPTTRISYTLDQPGSASLSVYDVRGRRIETMVPTRYHDRGSYSIPYAARGASGVYFLRLQTRFGERTIKIVELK